jgi:hypothetical protein
MNRIHTLTAALLLASAPLIATSLSAQTRGVSHPDENITVAAMAAEPAMPAAAASKPSADVAETPDVAAPDVTMAAPHRMHDDPDAGIVTYVPSPENELPMGTLIKVRMNETVNTKTTLDGTPFTAYLSEPVMSHGKVIIPAGAELHGTVEDVHSGARIFGRASLRLQANQIMLPDGSHYIINAQVIDTDQFHSTSVGNNGAIIHSDHAKMKTALFAVTAGSAAAAGAIIAGPTGAIVGASLGAGVITTHWLKQDGQTKIPVEARVVFSLTTSMPMIPLH